ncbi:MAG: DNA translocase FtsK, partial [Bacteroidia bacterium]|nr:DNA translocase FtsK [Bacteroidia bacterium]
EELSLQERIKLDEESETTLENTLNEKIPLELEKKEEEILKEEEPKKSLVRLKSASKVEILSEVEENKKLLLEIDQGECDKPKDFKLPPLSFLANPPSKTVHVNENEIDQKIQDLLEKLRRFKIEGDVVRTYSGPVVTTFEFKPAPHVKVSRILTLQDDLAMALRAKTIRIQAPVPGKDVVGIEVPNHKIETIYLKEILESEIFQKSSSPLTIALGKDIVGNAFVTDLKKLPHLLVAGTTGSGKSVGINAMLLSLLYRNSPDTLRFLMIDPKMLEFSIYNDIPHLLTPVITKPKQAIVALANMVSEMERRYQLMSRSRTKNIENYNEKAKSIGGEPLPYIVIIIDELADLMMTSGKDVEFYIARLAQMARASGIHIIVATQRPSVDVVTGLIKANLPSRISFKVGQKIDSKVILDAMGADSLLGNGDMLFTPPGTSGLIRLHAPYTTEDEID